DGRAGMAAVVLDANLDLPAFRAHLRERLPGYARPVFLRIRSTLDVTTTFKHTKQDLIRDGYDPAAVSDVVLFDHPELDAFAALFNLEAEGFRYSRISNPTTAVLERRVAALEGGVEALCVSTGQAALNYATLNVSELGTNIVSVPQLYGTTYTLFGHILPSQGVTVRFAASDRPEAIAALIDDQTRAVFCESVGNPA